MESSNSCSPLFSFAAVVCWNSTRHRRVFGQPAREGLSHGIHDSLAVGRGLARLDPGDSAPGDAAAAEALGVSGAAVRAVAARREPAEAETAASVAAAVADGGGGTLGRGAGPAEHQE